MAFAESSIPCPNELNRPLRTASKGGEFPGPSLRRPVVEIPNIRTLAFRIHRRPSVDAMDRPTNCSRCQVQFPTGFAHLTHLDNSLCHNICKLCEDKKDFETFATLQDHLSDKHFYCEPCHWFAPSKTGLKQHNVSRHNMCIACGDFFISTHELHGVSWLLRSKIPPCQNPHI